jgi:NAD(P)-dependent dehydrogenase (short-subunit alcohol dehydrogenase family)
MSEQQTVIVTGAASGLGEAEAHLMADRGWAVVGNDLGTGPHGEGSSEEPLDETIQDIRDNGGP